MKYLKQLSIATVLMCIAGFSFAASNVAVFNLQGAILGSTEAKKQLEELRNDSDYANLQARLESLRSDLENLRKEGETKGMTWSQEQVAEHRKEMESIGSDLQYTAKKMQSEQQAVMERIAQKVQPKVEAALNAVVAAEKIDIVLDRQSAYFASPSADITAKVVEKLNQE